MFPPSINLTGKQKDCERARKYLFELEACSRHSDCGECSVRVGSRWNTSVGEIKRTSSPDSILSDHFALRRSHAWLEGEPARRLWRASRLRLQAQNVSPAKFNPPPSKKTAGYMSRKLKFCRGCGREKKNYCKLESSQNSWYWYYRNLMQSGNYWILEVTWQYQCQENKVSSSKRPTLWWKY